MHSLQQTQLSYRYHHSNAYFIKTDPDGYYDDETSALVAWLIDKRDVALIDLAVSKGIKAKMGAYSNEERLAIKVFNEDEELWKHAEGLFSGNISYSKCISDKNIKLLEYLVEHVPVTESILRKAIEDRANEEMLALLIRHLDLSIQEKRPAGKLPIWYYGLRINNLVFLPTALDLVKHSPHFRLLSIMKAEIKMSWSSVLKSCQRTG